MLRMGKLTDYGIVVLNQLALSGSVQQSTEALMESTGLNRATVRKVMKYLADAGLVLTRRGAQGGYKIARPPRHIRVLDVVQAFEGNVALTECSHDEHDCDIENTCSLANRWVGINQLLIQLLSRISLADLQDPTLLNNLAKDMMANASQISLVNIP